MFQETKYGKMLTNKLAKQMKYLPHLRSFFYRGYCRILKISYAQVYFQGMCIRKKHKFSGQIHHLNCLYIVFTFMKCSVIKFETTAYQKEDRKNKKVWRHSYLSEISKVVQKRIKCSAYCFGNLLVISFCIQWKLQSYCGQGRKGTSTYYGKEKETRFLSINTMAINLRASCGSS